MLFLLLLCSSVISIFTVKEHTKNEIHVCGYKKLFVVQSWLKYLKRFG